MAKKSAKDRHLKGDVFEKEICELYEAMGYKVQPNISMHGQQVDLLACREMPGAGYYRILV